MTEPSKSSTKSTVVTTLPSSLQNNNQEYLETPSQPSKELHLSAPGPPLKSNSTLSAFPDPSVSPPQKQYFVDDACQVDRFKQQNSSSRKNENSVEEWTFYPSSGNHTYHTGKRCLFYGTHLRTKATSSERTLEKSIGRKKYVDETSSRNGIPMRMLGDHPFAAPEQSTDFHKKGSTLSPVNFGSSRYRKRSDTFIPLQRLPITSSVPFHVKEKELELEREKMEVQNLETWRPSPSLMQSLLESGQARKLTFS
ncbi:spermatogenesis-associated serine-rich protein 1 [Pantherophis guttatus]|uniref:Spermatogenesis-associated serine-rich protein 1 n=1 Tax=Pantherophis guttatus TaxID=94885 RepID=A0A6P9CTL0_PANGU|nr:spermatogenesis-associated serine-rich protein 1 [Pantherophis guttatus]